MIIPYGGYSIEQLQELVKAFFAVLDEFSALQSDISTPRIHAYFFNELQPQPRWAAFYDLSLSEHLFLAFKLLNVEGFYQNIADADDMQDTFISKLSQARENTAAPVIFKNNTESRLYFSAFFSLYYSLMSLSLWGQSINLLIQQSREGCEQSLYKALEVDRTCLTTPSVAACMGKAMILDDQAFFNQMSSAIKRDVYKRRAKNIEERFALSLLREMNGIADLTRDDLLDFLINAGITYAENADATKKFIRDWIREQQGKDIDLISMSSISVAKLHKVISHILYDIGSNKIWQIEHTLELLNLSEEIMEPPVRH